MIGSRNNRKRDCSTPICHAKPGIRVPRNAGAKGFHHSFSRLIVRMNRRHGREGMGWAGRCGRRWDSTAIAVRGLRRRRENMRARSNAGSSQVNGGRDGVSQRLGIGFRRGDNSQGAAASASTHPTPTSTPPLRSSTVRVKPLSDKPNAALFSCEI